jgi:hypothetical protein
MSEAETQSSLPLNRAPHGGWFRCEEEALRRIESSLESDGEIRFALVAYVTLCRKANLRRSEEFEDGMRSMAKDMAMATRDAQHALSRLAGLGLVEVIPQKIPGTNCSARNRYRLVRCIQYADTPCAPNDHTCREGSLLNTAHPFSQEVPITSKNSPKKREASPPRARFVPPTLEEAKAEALKNGMPEKEGQAFIDHHQAKGWVIGRTPMKDWRAAMRTWKRNWINFQTQRNGTTRTYVPVADKWGTE